MPSAAANGKTAIAICVPTRSRTEELDRLLQSLTLLHTTLPDGTQLDVTVNVCDNDPSISARRVIQKHQSSGLLSINDTLEPIPGYAEVRNRTLSHVPQSVKWIAFIDDDETASPSWLNELLACAERHQADIVCGPVIPQTTGPIPQWMTDLATVGHPDAPDGHPLEYGYTGNMLIRRRLLPSRPFNPDYGLSGGEDVELTRRLRQAGAKLVYAPLAVVHTTNNANNLDRRTLGHQHRIGSANYAHIQREQAGRLPIGLLSRSSLRLVQSSFIRWIGQCVKHQRWAYQGYLQQQGSLGIIEGSFFGRSAQATANWANRHAKPSTADSNAANATNRAAPPAW